MRFLLLVSLVVAQAVVPLVVAQEVLVVLVRQAPVVRALVVLVRQAPVVPVVPVRPVVALVVLVRQALVVRAPEELVVRALVVRAHRPRWLRRWVREPPLPAVVPSVLEHPVRAWSIWQVCRHPPPSPTARRSQMPQSISVREARPAMAKEREQVRRVQVRRGARCIPRPPRLRR